MKKFTKILISTILTLSVLGLTACGNSAPDDSSKPEESSKETKTISVGATPAPHAEILEAAREVLKEKGYELKIVEFAEYALINPALESGELDANYFQHTPYLNDFCEKQNADLTALVKIHFEPLGLYKGKTDSIENIKDGAEIAIPNDTTNGARALQLLEQNGIIKLKEDAGLLATENDIVENPHNVKIVPMIAAQLPRALADVDFAVINGNYALEADIMDKLLVTEDTQSQAAQEFANVIAVKAGTENDPAIVALKEALTSETVKNFINETYGSTVVPVF